MRSAAVSTRPKSPLSSRIGTTSDSCDRLVPDDRREARHPRVAVVAGVPDEREAALRAEHARDLGQGVVVVEPVERLRRGHDVRGRRRGAASPPPARRRRARPGSAASSCGAHLVERLDRGDAVAESDERTRQLPRAGAEVDDVDAARRRPASGQPRPGIRVGRARTRPRRRRTPCTGRAPVVAVDDHAGESRRCASCRLTMRVIPRPRSERDLRRAVAHRDEARHDVEDALPRAERDVRLELRRVLHEVAAALRRAEGLLRPAPRR